MDRDRFHNAARDGFLDALRETTRKDCNEKDEDGFTPTIVAAWTGENFSIFHRAMNCVTHISHSHK